MMIPSMTSMIVLDYLHELGCGWTGAGVAVECGCWLGASCAALASGLVEAGYNQPVFCYDDWAATHDQIPKAERYGVKLQYRQDTEPLFRANVAPIYNNLITRRGRIETAEWGIMPIEFFILDAAKTNPAFIQVLRIFGPSWIPGVTIVGLLDYSYWQKFHGPMRELLRCQNDFVERYKAHFAPMRDFEDSSPAFFRYVSAIKWGTGA